MTKIKHKATMPEATDGFLLVACTQQRLMRCLACRKESLIVISSSNHQITWCSHCATQVLLTAFDDNTGQPISSKQKINKWVDNGNLQFIQTSRNTLIITLGEDQVLGVSSTRRERPRPRYFG